MSGDAVSAVAPAASTREMQAWVRACMFGELVGFVPPAVIGVVLVVLGAPEPLLVVGLVAAGIGEGLVLGTAQSRVVTELLPGVTGWTRATATAAGIAWLAGMGGSSLVQSVGGVGLIVAVPGWMAGLLAMGLLQARRLVQVVDSAWRWVPITTAAWLIGVAVPVVALSLVPNGWPIATHVVVAVCAAVAMGAIVGGVSAPTLRRLARAGTSCPTAYPG